MSRLTPSIPDVMHQFKPAASSRVLTPTHGKAVSKRTSNFYTPTGALDQERTLSFQPRRKANQPMATYHTRISVTIMRCVTPATPSP